MVACRLAGHRPTLPAAVVILSFYVYYTNYVHNIHSELSYFLMYLFIYIYFFTNFKPNKSI